LPCAFSCSSALTSSTVEKKRTGSVAKIGGSQR